MTTSDRDLSSYFGQPIELYEFTRRSHQTISGADIEVTWRYTSSDRDYTFGGNVYTAMSITSDGVRQTGEAVPDQLNITLPASAAVPQMYKSGPPSDPIQFKQRVTHLDETDAFTTWVGYIGSVSRDTEAQATISCSAVTPSLSRGGLRLRYSRACPHALYDRDCRADPLAHYVVGTATAVANAAFICLEFLGTIPNGWSAGGFCEWITPEGFAERRNVITNDTTNGTVAIMGSTLGMQLNQTIYLFAGCNHATNDCNDKFNNLSNFGGHEYMAKTSPFDGNPIF